jgi:ATP-binding protein involved in chromosome partitioning
LARLGAATGILDADLYGPSIPAMLGLKEYVQSEGPAGVYPANAYGIKVMSMGMLVEEDKPAIWRGPMAGKVLQQFLFAVDWGELDYLILDLPPGTGDIPLTLAQTVSLNAAIIVTTPQQAALRIVQKGVRMFQQLNVPLAGLIENMSGWLCPSCGTFHPVFKQGGGRGLAESLGLPFLGSIPLDPRMVQAGDDGSPMILMASPSPAVKAFERVAQNMAARLSTLNLREGEVAHWPKEIHLLDQIPPAILWSDGSTKVYDPRELRLACPCARCVDQATGQRKISPSDVAEEVSIREARPAGRYGLLLVFSDGHDSGIFTFNLLNGLGVSAKI